MDFNSSGSSFDLGEGTTGESSSSPATSTPKKKGRKSRRGRQRASSPVLPLCDAQVGDIVWAKVKSSRWWPAILVNKEDCGKLVTLGGRKTTYFVFWYGDGRVSPIAMSNLVDFRKGYQKFIMPEGSRIFKSGIYMAIIEFRKSQSLDTEDWDIMKALAWADEGFPIPEGEGCDALRTQGTLSQHVREKLKNLRVKYETNGNGDDDDDDEGKQCETEDSTLYLEYTTEAVNLLYSVRDGTLTIEDICLACVSQVEAPKEHPLFYGGICEDCWTKFLERNFAIGLDLVAYHCSICMDLGDMMVCSEPRCFRAYCNKCIAMKATIGVLDIIRNKDPWLCFLCEPYSAGMHGLLQPRVSQWKQNIQKMFHPDVLDLVKMNEVPIRILCLDGSCKSALKLCSALKKPNIKVDSMFLCDYNTEEMSEMQAMLPNTKNVYLLKSLIHYEDYEQLSKIMPIHIVIASAAGKEKESLGRIFFSFHNFISMMHVLNNGCSKQCFKPIWLFEALPPLWDDYTILISRYLQVEPIEWSEDKDSNNSTLIWTNLQLFLDALNLSQPDKDNKVKTSCNYNNENQDESGSEEEARRFILRRKRRKQ
ncbi:hypothetical protein FOCC_FOCC014163 [Frankliniella occidentalis]|uniref:DNA (Cytosine-5)-methyltransferase 3B-like isoform X2 n=1 Tax=Frankliniella occidentalis TaxID=133901 RepID=A0A6J1SB65_FRAOC|nr:DNA (cytosine-5)-methyltransferase 3B-like isoform X2 [Frankliniella occidentalis]KAE8740315.1 hypothetical protein FOCC_FOCC014163 [Frankliniella occidentalis]